MASCTENEGSAQLNNFFPTAEDEVLRRGSTASAFPQEIAWQ